MKDFLCLDFDVGLAEENKADYMDYIDAYIITPTHSSTTENIKLKGDFFPFFNIVNYVLIPITESCAKCCSKRGREKKVELFTSELKRNVYFLLTNYRNVLFGFIIKK